jgi:hypothetical protein
MFDTDKKIHIATTQKCVNGSRKKSTENEKGTVWSAFYHRLRTDKTVYVLTASMFVAHWKCKVNFAEENHPIFVCLIFISNASPTHNTAASTL